MSNDLTLRFEYGRSYSARHRHFQYHESDAYRRHLTQQRAAELLGMPQPKLSDLFRGKFRGISQAKMIECLNRLGCDVDIVVRKEGRSVLGQTQVLVVE